MNSPLKTSTLAIALAAAFALSACGRNDDRTAGEKLDAGIAKTEQAAAEAKSDASAAVDRAKDAVAEAGSKTGTALENTAEKIGDTASDIGITAEVNAELAKDKALSAVSINVDTTNGHVSLHGKAPSTEARDRATVLAKAVKGVVTVDNKLEVGG